MEGSFLTLKKSQQKSPSLWGAFRHQKGVRARFFPIAVLTLHRKTSCYRDRYSVLYTGKDFYINDMTWSSQRKICTVPILQMSEQSSAVQSSPATLGLCLWRMTPQTSPPMGLNMPVNSAYKSEMTGQWLTVPLCPIYLWFLFFLRESLLCLLWFSVAMPVFLATFWLFLSTSEMRIPACMCMHTLTSSL